MVSHTGSRSAKRAPDRSDPSRKPCESASQSLTASLLLQSRLLSSHPPAYRLLGEDRPLTLDNVRIAFQLAALVGGRFLHMFMEGQGWAMTIYLAGRISRGVLPGLKIWAQSRLMDLVQQSFQDRTMDTREVLQTAALAMLASSADDIVRYFIRENDRRLGVHIDTKLERAYLATELSLPIHARSDPHISATMTEGGILVGEEGRVTHDFDGRNSTIVGQPFEHIANAFRLLYTLIDALFQLFLLYRAFSIGDIALGASSVFRWSKLAPIILALGPLALRKLVSSLAPARRRGNFNSASAYSSSVKLDAKEFSRKDGEYKQEAVLFGLKDWVLGRWDEMKRKTDRPPRLSRLTSGMWWVRNALDNVDVDEAIQKGVYVLLALRILPSTFTLGSVTLYGDALEALLGSIRAIRYSAQANFQLIFYIAAYVEAADLPSHPELFQPGSYRDSPLLDYDDHRVPGGMGLVATNLRFRYPGTPTNILHDINLTIPSGSTLAIVGLNGGGKSTLVKVLLGLYGHQGSLTLNGFPFQSFDPASVHRRTSCLFQDYRKYALTLRENVGLGNVGQIEDDEAVMAAIGKGGAEGVLEQVGLEGSLNRSVWEEGYGYFMSGGDGGGGQPVTSRDGMVGKMLAVADKGFVRSALSGIKWIFSRPTLSASPSLASSTTAPPSDLKRDSPSRAKAAASARGRTMQPSGGQWQRVALSRAFMRASEADLIVFDEPSASLDPRAEAELFDRIHSLSRQSSCTTIYISHRFSTVKKADQIAVVEGGTIIECGSHTELMAKDGRYCELYTLQRGGFD